MYMNVHVECICEAWDRAGPGNGSQCQCQKGASMVMQTASRLAMEKSAKFRNAAVRSCERTCLRCGRHGEDRDAEHTRSAAAALPRAALRLLNAFARSRGRFDHMLAPPRARARASPAGEPITPSRTFAGCKDSREEGNMHDKLRYDTAWTRSARERSNNRADGRGRGQRQRHR
ncbi:hypothetical protein DENSPDRAFT_431079 [Dentipellis sp. KUC8613]|nr:hypothetical protein DENSPDRAFT_431079 [Dentipellis sp. KUC8613]